MIYLLAIIAIVIAVYYWKEKKKIENDIHKLERHLESHHSKNDQFSHLRFSSPALCSLWQQCTMLQQLRLKEEKQIELTEKAIGTGKELASYVKSKSDLAKELLQFLQKKTPSITKAAGIFLINECENYDLIQSYGIPEERLKNALEYLIQESTSCKHWGYIYPQKNQIWDLSIFDIGMSYIEPLSNTKDIEGILWIGMNYPLENLSVHEKHFISILAKHVSTLFKISAKIIEEKSLSDNAKSNLYSISHDLKSPSISALFLIKDLLDNPSIDPSSKRQLEIAVNALEDQLILIKETLKPTSTTQTIETEPINAKILIESIVKQYDKRARKKGIDLLIKDNAKCNLACNATHAKRIIQNLIDNAIKYTDRGQIEIHVEERETTAKISIHDTGIGIPQNETKFLFQHQNRLSNAIAKEGNGLGLSNCMELARANNALCDFKPKENGGSIFSVTFQRSDKPRSLLIVEDEPAICRFYKKHLKDSAKEVFTADSIEEAKKIFDQHRPDVIIADYYLGKENTTNFLKTKKEENPNLSIVVATGREQLPEDLTSQVYLLQKPFKKTDLIKLLGELP